MNRIIRQASVIGLFLLAVTIGVSAQANQQYRAEIPFSFEAAGKHYEAGNYAVGPLSQASSPGGIVLRDSRNKVARVLGVNAIQGDNNWDKQGKLTFLKVNGRYTLTQISTPTFIMEMKSRKSKGDLAKQTPADAQVVAINLTR